MGQALYRKYRSRGFDQVVGQDHVVKTLKNALESGRISHAYLFTGPRGVGKTSVARILAHEVNGLPYDEDTVHLDIIEIDAASNRRIDEIRELRERVHVAPAAAKYKVYIIDEVHMLTREAFNALLKTLEEPPAHCIFILATTEAHKLPETIISRTQRFTFKPADKDAAAKHLQDIAKREKIDIEPAALELLAEHGGGSFRDSLGLLDQLSGLAGKVTEQKAREFLGLPAATAVKKLLADIDKGDLKAVSAGLDELRGQGVDAALLARALNEQLRTVVLEGQGADWSLKLLRRLSSIGSAANPQAALEIDLLEAAGINCRPATKPDPSQEVRIEPEQPSEPEPDDNPLPPSEEPPKPDAAMIDFNLDNWPTIVAEVKKQAPSLYTALRLAEPRLENGRLILSFQFPLHQKKVVQAKNLDALGQIIEQLTGGKVKIECQVDKNLKLKPARQSSPIKTNTLRQDPSLQAISNIFGTAEVLES